ncbi:GNAT family N-acetyltransferase [Leifsonia sp. YAF41]|uniref:GNAT family N-acetyltransferase n=1 Tax=Leifsonia sp. YAF41 TaxID=3233086 RepID=UPI003F99EF0D
MIEAVSNLAARVDAPTRLDLPRHPEVQIWRPADREDLDQVWRLSRTVAQADHPNHLTTREGVTALFSRHYFQPEWDSLLGFDDAGRLVAAGMVHLPSGRKNVARSIVIGGVHPDLRGRGIGRTLLAWQIGRAKQQLAHSGEELPGWVLAFADERAPRKRRLLESTGFALRRHFVALERVLADPIATIDLVDGVRLTRFSEQLSTRVHEARDAAFEDHWGSQPMSEETWEAFIGGSSFRPELSAVALAASPHGRGDMVVGFGLGSVNAADWPHQGFRGSYIDMLGVVPEWRGRRLASAVLCAQLLASRNAGYERVTLDVDADSQTGAYRLYQRQGFTPAHQKFAYTIEY